MECRFWEAAVSTRFHRKIRHKRLFDSARRGILIVRSKEEVRRMSERQRTCIAIDLKSYYASVECMARGLDPMTTNLVVADISRTEKTICLAVSPALKAYGIPGRARIFEVVERVKEVNAERRREESAIVIKATDRYSETVKRKGETTKSFGKNLGKTEDILTLLSKNKATIRVDVKQAKAPCRMRKSSLRKPAAKRTS